ncbi:hypothetical protein, partial [Nostoc sp.]
TTIQNKKPLSFIRHKLRLILVPLIYNTFTNMRSRKEHIGNENKNYCAADEFWLSLVSLIIHKSSNTQVKC